MLIRLISLFILLLTTMIQAPPAGTTKPAADDILGIWISQAQDSKTKIVKAGDTYCGQLLAGWGNELYEADGKTLRKDLKNPDASRRDQPLQGMVIISGLRYENGRYTGGKFYDARMGKTFHCDMKLNAGTLEMRIYWGFPLLGMTKRWTRTEK